MGAGAGRWNGAGAGRFEIGDLRFQRGIRGSGIAEFFGMRLGRFRISELGVGSYRICFCGRRRDLVLKSQISNLKPPGTEARDRAAAAGESGRARMSPGHAGAFSNLKSPISNLKSPGRRLQAPTLGSAPGRFLKSEISNFKSPRALRLRGEGDGWAAGCGGVSFGIRRTFSSARPRRGRGR